MHPGWWGFVFPVGAMTLSITAVGAASGVWAVQAVGLLSTIVLALLWAYVAATTARLVRQSQQSAPVGAL